ncbi:MAG: DivIVA domain-containing protein [candidate division KSB1 bacterium]|nr:DivIVA domain-containing protein [candidate division KSB1 bacterium]MDZ7334051.1 DivIVA domain-containing protein [candidate division KSB1 bacterium]MDZ7356877.1 DivIVA domain-containing protein [candidate division KSB1 bacterium]MDZ7399539.1 DivIVA domain-containing protein [candidate division KSB1 bacterium]
MKLTPLDIKKQVFKKVLRGYDPIEIETFLEMVAEEFEALIKERNDLSDEVLKLKTQLRDYQEVEKTFKESLMNAQQTINQSRENSKREADLIIKEAEVRAEKIIENAKMQLIEIKNELMVIKAQKDSFAKRLRHLLESQLELLSVLEIDDLGFGEPNTAPKPKELKYQIREPAFLATASDQKKKDSDASADERRKDVKISDQFIF